MRIFGLLIILISTYRGFGQSKFQLSLLIKPNFRNFTDYTKKNMGSEYNSSLYAKQLIFFHSPIYSVQYEHKKVKYTASYFNNSGAFYGEQYPGFCEGILPAFRNIDYFSLGAGYSLRTKSLEFVPNVAAAYQTGSNTYAACSNIHPLHSFYLGERFEYATFGLNAGFEANYHFPKKDRAKIVNERFLVGLNGIYTHLPNEVDHFSYGFHFGLNFLGKKNRE